MTADNNTKNDEKEKPSEDKQEQKSSSEESSEDSQKKHISFYSILDDLSPEPVKYEDSKKRRTRKKNKKSRKLFNIISLVAICVILYFVFLNVRFSIKDDIMIDTPTRHIFMDLTQEDPANLEIYSTVQTSTLCRAHCTQKFININSNEVLYEEDFKFKRFYRVNFQKTVYPYTLGEGQDTYLYIISCKNIATSNCPAKNGTIEKDVIITLNRKLTEKEIYLKKSQEALLKNAYSSFNEGSMNLDSSKFILVQLKYAKKEDLDYYLNISIDKENDLNNSLIKSKEAWLTYNHSLIQQVLEQENIDSKANELRIISRYIYNTTLTRISQHNNAVELSYFIAQEIQTSKNVLSQSKQFLGNHYPELNSKIKNANSLYTLSTKNLYSKNFENYSSILTMLSYENKSITEFKELYLNRTKDNIYFTNAQLDLLISEEDSCIILNKDLYNIYNCRMNFSEQLINYNNITYNELSSSITSFCSEYDNISKLNSVILEKAYESRNNISELYLIQANNLSAKYRAYNLIIHRNELMSRTDFSAVNAVKMLNTYIAALEEEYGFSAETLQVSTFNSLSVNEGQAFYMFIPINFTFNNIKSCEPPELGVIYPNLNYEIYIVPYLDQNSERYNQVLPELVPRACFDGECKQYNTNSSDNYPLVIVHGHSFYSKNYKITPSQVHNDLQTKLLSDKMYIPAGILRETDPVIENSLGYIDAPFVYKAAYYPDEILDNESINLFADRLNKIIMNAKKETGKDKVVIISHSMGGLVTRAYMKKYGTNDIKLVIIGGTPNYGVTSDTVSLCKLFGRNLECDEMYENSEFISNLKDEPEYKIPIYTLRGEGCGTFGKDGDGVVQSRSVPLPYAHNFAFNGTCSLTGDFHVNLLNPDENPDIYNKIKEILIENR